LGEEESNTVSKSRETSPQTASDYQDWPTGWALILAPLGMPWVRLKLSTFLRNLRNLSRELLPNVYSQAVLLITFSRVLYLHVLSCRQSLSPAIQKTYIPVAQIKLHCLSSQLSHFLTKHDQTWPCQFMSMTGLKAQIAISVSRIVVI